MWRSRFWAADGFPAHSDAETRPANLQTHTKDIQHLRNGFHPAGRKRGWLQGHFPDDGGENAAHTHRGPSAAVLLQRCPPSSKTSDPEDEVAQIDERRSTSADRCPSICARRSALPRLEVRPCASTFVFFVFCFRRWRSESRSSSSSSNTVETIRNK